MPTQSERKALIFLGAVACLGGGVRVMRAHTAPPPVAARRALDAQISSASGRSGPGRARGDTNPPTRRRRRPATAKAKTVVVRHPTPPPPPDPYHRVDVDRASAVELQALPGIGPALAGRIVAFRDSAGPFGTLARLGKVKGIGPATLKRLDSLVTFSGVRRP
jgi:competence protein ComEA